MSKQKAIFIATTGMLVLACLIPVEYANSLSHSSSEFLIGFSVFVIISAIATLLIKTEKKVEGEKKKFAVECGEVEFCVSQQDMKEFRKYFRKNLAGSEATYFSLFAVLISGIAVVLIFAGYNAFIVVASCLVFLAYAWYIKEFSRPESMSHDAGVNVVLSTEYALMDDSLYNWSADNIRLENVVLRKINQNLYYLAVYYNEHYQAYSTNRLQLALELSGIAEKENQKKQQSVRIPVPASEVPNVKPIADALLAVRNSTVLR